MSLLLMESCDLNNGRPEDIGQKWANISANVTNGVVVDGRTCWQDAEIEKGISYNLVAGEQDATIIMGVRFQSNSGGFNTGNLSQRSIMSVFGNGDLKQIDVPLRGSNTIAIRRGVDGVELGRTPVNTLVGGVWYYLELKVFLSDTVGTVELRVNGQVVINETGLDTLNGATALVERVDIGCMRDMAASWRDIYILNTAGTALNDFLGPVVVEAVVPNGAGNYTDWTPDAGSNFARVNESDPDGDTTYVEAAVAALRDSYAFGDLSVIASNPLAVQATAFARFTDAPIDLAMMLRRASTDIDGTPATPAGSFTSAVTEIWEDDPVAAAAWTVANFNATEFGIKT